jgi:hypothetical protein
MNRQPLKLRISLAAFGALLLSLLPATAAAASQEFGVIAITPYKTIAGTVLTGTGDEQSALPGDMLDPPPPPPPTFVCGGEPCANPRPNSSLPNPPQWLTSPNAAGCLISLGAIHLNSSLTDLQQVSGEQANLAKTNGLLDPKYWLVQVQAYANSTTYPECREWMSELRSGK